MKVQIDYWIDMRWLKSGSKTKYYLHWNLEDALKQLKELRETASDHEWTITQTISQTLPV